jgi:hypothetical protein
LLKASLSNEEHLLPHVKTERDNVIAQYNPGAISGVTLNHTHAPAGYLSCKEHNQWVFFSKERLFFNSSVQLVLIAFPGIPV